VSQLHLRPKRDILMPHHFFWHVVKEESAPLVRKMVVEPPYVGSWGVQTAKYGPSWPK